MDALLKALTLSLFILFNAGHQSNNTLSDDFETDGELTGFITNNESAYLMLLKLMEDIVLVLPITPIM